VPITTIDDVLSRLDHEIAHARAEGARWGYFPALYRTVTAEVKRAIEDGEFEDGPRMEHLDVRFAVRYFDALDQWRAGAGPTRSWQIALHAAERADLLVLQHLLLGMNAHIMLDLAVAAAEIAPGERIAALQRDFFHINDLLARMVDGAEAAIARSFPALGRLDRVAGGRDEAMATFSIEEARDIAWTAATTLATMKDPARKAHGERMLDDRTSLLGRLIGAPLPGGHAVVRLLEPGAQAPEGVRKAIDALVATRRGGADTRSTPRREARLTA